MRKLIEGAGKDLSGGTMKNRAFAGQHAGDVAPAQMECAETAAAETGRDAIVIAAADSFMESGYDCLLYTSPSPRDS